jgi:hypothetical protein
MLPPMDSHDGNCSTETFTFTLIKKESSSSRSTVPIQFLLVFNFEQNLFFPSYYDPDLSIFSTGDQGISVIFFFGCEAFQSEHYSKKLKIDRIPTLLMLMSSIASRNAVWILLQAWGNLPLSMDERLLNRIL